MEKFVLNSLRGRLYQPTLFSLESGVRGNVSGFTENYLHCMRMYLKHTIYSKETYMFFTSLPSSLSPYESNPDSFSAWDIDEGDVDLIDSLRNIEQKRKNFGSRRHERRSKRKSIRNMKRNKKTTKKNAPKKISMKNSTMKKSKMKNEKEIKDEK
jgi:hypothetical protein